MNLTEDLALLGFLLGLFCLTMGAGWLISSAIADWRPDAGPGSARGKGLAFPLAPPLPAPPIPVHAGSGEQAPRSSSGAPTAALAGFRGLVLGEVHTGIASGAYWRLVAACDHQHGEPTGALECARWQRGNLGSERDALAVVAH